MTLNVIILTFYVITVTVRSTSLYNLWIIINSCFLMWWKWASILFCENENKEKCNKNEKGNINKLMKQYNNIKSLFYSSCLGAQSLPRRTNLTLQNRGNVMDGLDMILK